METIACNTPGHSPHSNVHLHGANLTTEFTDDVVRRFLVNDQRDAQIPFYVFISISNSLHVSGTLCSSSGETDCVNTTSGNCHSVLVAVSCTGW